MRITLSNGVKHIHVKVAKKDASPEILDPSIVLPDKPLTPVEEKKAVEELQALFVEFSRNMSIEPITETSITVVSSECPDSYFKTIAAALAHFPNMKKLSFLPTSSSLNLIVPLFLKNCPYITNLYISRGSINVQALSEDSKSICRLEVLDIRENGIDDDDILTLATALKNPNQLKILHLAGNDLADSKNIITLLSHCPSLEFFSLWDNSFSVEEMRKILAVVKYNFTITNNVFFNSAPLALTQESLELQDLNTMMLRIEEKNRHIKKIIPAYLNEKARLFTHLHQHVSIPPLVEIIRQYTGNDITSYMFYAAMLTAVTNLPWQWKPAQDWDQYEVKCSEEKTAKALASKLTSTLKEAASNISTHFAFSEFAVRMVITLQQIENLFNKEKDLQLGSMPASTISEPVEEHILQINWEYYYKHDSPCYRAVFDTLSEAKSVYNQIKDSWGDRLWFWPVVSSKEGLKPRKIKTSHYIRLFFDHIPSSREGITRYEVTVDEDGVPIEELRQLKLPCPKDSPIHTSSKSQTSDKTQSQTYSKG